jgi:hypothetical protein
VILLKAAGDALGYLQEGGVVLASAGAGHRAGLGQRGGVLVVLGPLGRLAGERQAGGRLFALAGQLGPYAGHARRGGALIGLARPPMLATGPEDASNLGLCLGPDLTPDDAEILRGVLHAAGPWLSGPAPGKIP